MSNYVKYFSALSAGALMGCSQFAMAPTNSAPKVQSLERITSPVSEVERLFIMGRTAHASRQMALAEERYKKVLGLQPEHLGALNAMAVIYAQTQRPEQAYETFQRALAIDPKAAHIRNNFGYALILAGRLDEAQEQLNLASELNPASELTHKNQEILAHAKGNIQVAEAPKPITPKGPQLVAVYANVYELRDTAAVVARPTSISTNGTINALLSGVKIEVSNGVGITNLAHRTAKRLAPMGLVTARMTNQLGYKQVTTEIFYSPGQQNAAQALSEKLPMTPKVLAAKDLNPRVQMRLVLGHDVDEKAMAAWLDEQQAPLVALNLREGWYW